MHCIDSNVYHHSFVSNNEHFLSNFLMAKRIFLLVFRNMPLSKLMESIDAFLMFFRLRFLFLAKGNKTMIAIWALRFVWLLLFKDDKKEDAKSVNK